MNLIEQLGGYEAAKRYAESRNGADNTGVYDSLQAALLEYRRTNNIFEVGDKVVIAGNGSLFEVVIPRSEYSDRYIALAIIFKNLARLKYADWYERDSVSHATGAEIAAGKRLGVV